MKPVQLEPAFVLHKRAYRETSLLIELWTQNHGRFSAVAKGVRKTKSSSQGLLQPFSPILVSFVGKGELMTLTQVESRQNRFFLQGDCLFAGLYLNELLMYVLQKWDPHENLFHFYEQTLADLCGQPLEQRVLRRFERLLLEELGYGLLPKSEEHLAQSFIAEKAYRFLPEQGFSKLEPIDEIGSGGNVFSGKSLLAIAREEWSEEVLLDAKRLMRMVLSSLLGERKIFSRRLFLKPEEREYEN